MYGECNNTNITPNPRYVGGQLAVTKRAIMAVLTSAQVAHSVRCRRRTYVTMAIIR